MEGVDYLILGQENPNNLGLPDVPSIEFSYENVADELTFHWFKHHIMCKEHPWICNDGSSDEGVPKNQKKNKPSGGGSKKSRRKNKNSSGAESSNSHSVSVGGSRRNLLDSLSSRKPEEQKIRIKSLNRCKK